MKDTTAYCSCCFQRTWHTPAGKNKLGRRVYTCSNCGNRTLVCSALKCQDIARGEGKVDDLQCAAHQGKIAGFSRLTMRLSEIDEYQPLFEREVANLGKVERIGAAAVGGGVLLGPAAFLAAPAVGGAIGSTFFGLSGAAAVSKGLATLGLGALSAGGFGMAGGVAVVTALGAASGGALSGVIANAYFGEVDDFRITRLKDGKGPSVLVINGFLTQEEKNLEREWLNTLGHHYLRNPWYLVEWESKRLRQIAKLATDVTAQKSAAKVLAELGKRATRASSRRLIPIDWAIAGMKLSKNPWHVAVAKAPQTGALLAHILSRTPGPKKYVLMGHSLGARVIYSALRGLAGGDVQRIKAVHLLGGAVGTGKKRDWEEAASAVYGEVHNYYSKRDEVLRVLYTAGRAFLGTPAIGRNPIRCDAVNLVNHDVTAEVPGHREYERASVGFLLA
jgi:hypothetical protein